MRQRQLVAAWCGAAANAYANTNTDAPAAKHVYVDQTWCGLGVRERRLGASWRGAATATALLVYDADARSGMDLCERRLAATRAIDVHHGKAWPGLDLRQRKLVPTRHAGTHSGTRAAVVAGSASGDYSGIRRAGVETRSRLSTAHVIAAGHDALHGHGSAAVAELLPDEK